MNSLTAAVEVLLPVIYKGMRLDHALAKIADKPDKPLIQQLCYGVLRYHHYLEEILRMLIQKPLAAKHNDIKLLLMLGIFQIRELNVPDHAAVNETVSAADLFKKTWAKGLINATLRNYIRTRPKLESNLGPEGRFSHPAWLIEEFEHHYGKHSKAILAANNTKAPMTLRVNLAKTSRADYLQLLEQEEMSAECCAYAQTGVVLSQAVNVNRLPMFKEGWVSVQDESSQLVIPLLELASGQKVLDACAAPGGKTCHILESCDNLAQVVAVEMDSSRTAKLESNLRRLGLRCDLLIEDLRNLDFGNPDQSILGDSQFDRILLDAPCSATGTIRRHPDIKIRRHKIDIDRFSSQQFELLQAAWQALAPGGILVYTTCSVLPQENEQVIHSFLQSVEDAEIQLIPGDWGLDRKCGKILLPTVGGHDGFFYAKLRKLHIEDS